MCICVCVLRLNDFDTLDILQFSVPKHENINKYSAKFGGGGAEAEEEPMYISALYIHTHTHI